MGIEHEEFVEERRMRQKVSPRSSQQATAIEGEVGEAILELLGHALLLRRGKEEKMRGERRSYPSALLRGK